MNTVLEAKFPLFPSYTPIYMYMVAWVSRLSVCMYFLPIQADRPYPDGETFTYPYDFGWKENFKQVDMDVFIKSVVSMPVALYIPWGMYTSWGFYNAEVQRRQILGLKLALWQAVIMIYKSQTNGDLYKWIYGNAYIYLNCRERYEDIIYHLIITCYAHNLRSYVIKPEKN